MSAIDRTTRVRVLLEIARERTADPGAFAKLQAMGEQIGRRIADDTAGAMAKSSGDPSAEQAVGVIVEDLLAKTLASIAADGFPETEQAAFTGGYFFGISARYDELAMGMSEAGQLKLH